MLCRGVGVCCARVPAVPLVGAVLYQRAKSACCGGCAYMGDMCARCAVCALRGVLFLLLFGVLFGYFSGTFSGAFREFWGNFGDIFGL